MAASATYVQSERPRYPTVARSGCLLECSFAHATRQARHDSGSELLRKSHNDQVQIVLIIAAPSDRVASPPHTGEVRFSLGMSFAHDTQQVRHNSGSEVLRKSHNDQVQIVLIIAAPSDRVASPPFSGEARLDSGMSSRTRDAQQ